ncbi:Hsp20/alpha crystallin family protein [soil metagenome]
MLSPFRGFRDARSEMEQMFDEMLGGLARRPVRQRAQSEEWAPAIDAVSKDGDLVIKAELPGVKLDDVDITLQNSVLTISGEHKAGREEERGGYHVRERRYGTFRRSMTLPENVDESKIHARFEDGVLEVIAEGATAVQEPKRIEIEGGDGESES